MHYVRCPDLKGLWRASREKADGEARFMRKYAAFQVLVLNERALDRPDEPYRTFLLELMEAHYGPTSTVFCTQSRQKDRHARLGGGVHADAIMDHIVHDAVWINIGEMNMRRKLGPRFEAQEDRWYQKGAKTHILFALPSLHTIGVEQAQHFRNRCFSNFNR